MLVIISDLHLTDQSSGASVPRSAFDIFAMRLRDQAMRASWRSDGRYRPIERIDLVLLGDILDLTRSNRWITAGVRPWDDLHSPEVISTTAGIIDDILRRNSDSLAVLRSLAADSAVTVPPLNANGEPVFGVEGYQVPVRTHYMVGNSDWMLHLRGPNYDLMRQMVAHHLGLANSHNAPFPHDPIESDELLEALRRHRVFARHGDIFDPINYSEDRDGSSLGDAIVIQLVGRFVHECREKFAGDLPQAIINGLAELDHIRPLLLIPAWLEGLLNRSCPKPAVRKQVKQLWDSLADELLQLRIVRERDSWSPFDLVDGLEGALKFNKRLSLGWAARIAQWSNSLRGAESSSYYQHALAEQDFRNRRARQIVYGHTHAAETIPLDASSADGFVLNQMYFNTGTWRRVYTPTQYAQGEQEFIPADCMSYLSFFQGDEHGGRPFETWSGSLGIGTPVARPQTETASRSRAASAVPAPHFALHAARTPQAT